LELDEHKTAIDFKGRPASQTIGNTAIVAENKATIKKCATVP
jgi:hypothetical protein